MAPWCLCVTPGDVFKSSPHSLTPAAREDWQLYCNWKFRAWSERWYAGFFFLSSQQLQTADVLTLRREIKPHGTFLPSPPLYRGVLELVQVTAAAPIGARTQRLRLSGCFRAKVSELHSPPSVCINCCHGDRPEALCRGDKRLYELMRAKLFFSRQFSRARQMEIDLAALIFMLELMSWRLNKSGTTFIARESY